MQSRVSCFALVMLFAPACGEVEERNPPPVGSGGASAGPVGGVSSPGSGTGSSTSSGTDTDTDMDTDTDTDASSSDSTGGTYVVLSGSFNDNGGGYALPITCTVRFHLPGQINPSSGISTATTFSRPFTIDAFPQPFTIDSDEIGDVVVPGDTGYVTSQCDIDGDNFFDDNAGGYFPNLPLAEVTVPGSSLDIFVGPL